MSYGRQSYLLSAGLVVVGETVERAEVGPDKIVI